MPLKILSGVIMLHDAPKTGEITISFDPHERVSGSTNADVKERKQIGSDGRFTAAPAKHVAVRQVAFSVQDPPFGSVPFTKFRINDDISRDNLVVKWEGVEIAFFEEISYMVIGEVP
jgi:hypothetical protein